MIKNLITQQEGKTLEFKRDLSSPKSLLKSIVAFANTAGGHLIIGVNDERQIIGVEHPLDEEERLCNLIADSISPRLIPSIELVTLNNKTLLVIEVFVSNTGPHWINSEGSTQGIYVRLGSTNRQADQELITELHRRSEGVNFDEMPMPQLSVDDVDITKAQELFSDIKSLNEKNLLTLKLITSHQGKLVPTKGAILLFGKERNTYFPDAWVQCGRFIGKDKSRIFDHVDIYDYLPDAVESIMMFLKKHALRGADFSAVQRKDIWSIPLVMLREAVINALVHTDYSQRGAPIRISFFDDRIEIENPGILLPGLTIEDMRQGISKIRNHVIARVFRELNLIEQWGSGVSRIYSEAIEQKLQEPEIIEIGMRIRFIIYLAQGIPIDSTFDKRDKQLESRLEPRLESRLESKLAARVIQVLQNGEAGKIQIARSLGHQTVSGELHKQIKQLLKLEIIEMTIPDKPNSRLQKYRLTNKGIDLINIIQREL
ncbi:helix-turn-helix domain-containing protein [Legionella pneumophila]|nr:helix-turn-helix domain-containing protein [Legionella pneumophila]MDW8940876.1 helix-turn-helix domain-containing protein [Legionella pneumophila]MDW8946002.1 helix-turn-helix domain-containing protein [Legionella pneumophila]MDW8953047.1 helix-turn-helix domain-containing protein [Legionella pneumophila]MDW8965067.1 helix-turn-helix domain-containing protein [Legionella pneumophila]